MTHIVMITSLLCIACSASPKINVGNEPDGSVAGSGGASGSAGLGGFGGGDNTLTALITEPPSEMSIEVITIACSGECKQVLAVASGGNDPYSFAWNDGVTSAARAICATDDTTFTVTVSDTAIIDGEFPYAGQSATASVTAQVLVCPDAGVADGGSEACAESFKPGTYVGSFAQSTGLLSGTHTLVLTTSPGLGGQVLIGGALDNELTGTATKAMVTWGDGSFYDCATRRLFLSGVRSEPGAVPLPYTYEATLDPAADALSGRWAAAAPTAPGVYPTMAIDSGIWDAHWQSP